MAAPKLSKIVGVKVAAANIGEFVILRNLSNGETLTKAIVGTDKSVVFNAAPDSEWNAGDQIQAEVTGRLTGVKREKITTGKTPDIIIAASVNTATLGVTL